LLNIIAGLLPPTSGRILLDGEEVRGPGRERGMVFQQDAILMWRKVLGNVEYGLELRGVPKEERRRAAMDYVRLVGLEPFADFFPKELSGGMRKRVQIAAVFANNPEVLLMDEPFGSLDYPTKVSLQEEVLKIWAAERKTTLFVTHDVEEALFLADRIFVMQNGRVDTVVSVPFPRPRLTEVRGQAEFRDLLVELWGFLTEPS
jgi:NitT/TauT family transport system ATP-binding protein